MCTFGFYLRNYASASDFICCLAETYIITASDPDPRAFDTLLVLPLSALRLFLAHSGVRSQIYLDRYSQLSRLMK